MESFKALRSTTVNFFTKGHAQTVIIKKNVAFSFLLKGLSILINLALVPVTINYLGQEQYGIWLTLTSIIGWMSFFDIGLGNGLRNKLSEALANNNLILAKSYISTSYAALILIVLTIASVFFLINFYIDWSKILKSSPEISSEVSILAIVVVSSFFIQFPLKLISTVLVANQKTAINDSINVTSNLISLIIIVIIINYTMNSILLIGTVMSFVPIVTLCLFSFFFYYGNYKHLRPSYKDIKIQHFRELGSIGSHFFIIQIAAIVLFSTDNMIITHILGPAEVTPYNISFKYFNVVTMIYYIILTPFWSAFTHAYHKGDFTWIKNSTKYLVYISILFSIGVFFLIFISDKVYSLWVGESIKISNSLTICMGLFTIIQLFATPFTYFINGVGKIRLQLYTAIIACSINIPLSIYLGKNLGLGSAGVILATCVCNFSSVILWPIQFFKIINKKEYGIWAK